LAQLGYDNVNVVVGDGTQGLPEAAPFDRIIVAAAAPHVPAPLLQQLREGGRMVIPVGAPEMQELQLIRKLGGEAVVSTLEGCRFVPLIGEEGFRQE
jgi:protein-L-isoaspartate(D-aspartate) O-methyltransferase